MIWIDKNVTIHALQELGKGTMGEFINIKFTEVGENFLKASMPVDERTRQPYGLLHGGASCVLAETLGSIGSALLIDRSRFICVGLEINANHIRSAKKGLVTGVATPLHVGNSTHVWDIKIYNDEEKLICVSRLTVAILPKQ